MLSIFPFATFIVPLAKDQICLAREENVGYVGRFTFRTAFVDGVIVFAIFIMVRSPL